MTRPVRQSIFVLLTLLLSLSLALPAVAKKRSRLGTDSPTEDQLAIRDLRQKIAAEELAASLALTTEQEEALAEVVSQTVERRAAHKSERRARAPELRTLLEDYLREVQEDGTASEASAEAIRAFRAANKADRSSNKELREGARDQLREILTEDQLGLLKDFRPMSQVGRDKSARQDQQQGRKARSKRLRERVGDENFEELRAMQRQGQERRKTRSMVRKVLFSEAMLEILQR
ncbi:MAG: hypothetical protein VX498_03520 [Myxococcota bacterium]|nr:hypothetical protein [Myxococcota bacterium]